MQRSITEATAEATKLARENRETMAIVLTADEDTGVSTFEWCPNRAVETLYGPLLRAGLAAVVDRVFAPTAYCAKLPRVES